MNKTPVYFLSVALLCFITGCASTPKIHYVPKHAPLKTNSVSVWIQNFEDARTVIEKNVLGGVYNGYGMRLGDVQEPGGMIASIRDAFAAELQNRGYALVNDDKDLVVQATVQTVTCDMSNVRLANLVVRLIVCDKGKEVVNKIYTGNASIFFTLDMTCSEPLGKALEDIVKKFGADLDGYIKKEGRL
jgi:hypothetical protein